MNVNSTRTSFPQTSSILTSSTGAPATQSSESLAQIAAPDRELKQSISFQRLHSSDKSFAKTQSTSKVSISALRNDISQWLKILTFNIKNHLNEAEFFAKQLDQSIKIKEKLQELKNATGQLPHLAKRAKQDLVVSHVPKENIKALKIGSGELCSVRRVIHTMLTKKYEMEKHETLLKQLKQSFQNCNPKLILEGVGQFDGDYDIDVNEFAGSTLVDINKYRGEILQKFIKKIKTSQKKASISSSSSSSTSSSSFSSPLSNSGSSSSSTSSSTTSSSFSSSLSTNSSNSRSSLLETSHATAIFSPTDNYKNKLIKILTQFKILLDANTNDNIDEQIALINQIIQIISQQITQNTQSSSLTTSSTSELSNDELFSALQSIEPPPSLSITLPTTSQQTHMLWNKKKLKKLEDAITFELDYLSGKLSEPYLNSIKIKLNIKEKLKTAFTSVNIEKYEDFYNGQDVNKKYHFNLRELGQEFLFYKPQTEALAEILDSINEFYSGRKRKLIVSSSPALMGLSANLTPSSSSLSSIIPAPARILSNSSSTSVIPAIARIPSRSSFSSEPPAIARILSSSSSSSLLPALARTSSSEPPAPATVLSSSSSSSLLPALARTPSSEQPATAKVLSSSSSSSITPSSSLSSLTPAPDTILSANVGMSETLFSATSTPTRNLTPSTRRHSLPDASSSNSLLDDFRPSSLERSRSTNDIDNSILADRDLIQAYRESGMSDMDIQTMLASNYDFQVGDLEDNKMDDEVEEM